MESPSPSPPPPPQTTGNLLFSRSPSSPRFSLGCDPENPNHASRHAEISEEGSDRVYVAVGKSVKRANDLLQWTFQQLRNREICLVHVHQPSPTIPTLLGRLPASGANEEVVSAYRREEREQTRELMNKYLRVCSKAKVKATVTTIESGQVHEGIVELVKKHGIRKLVMGAVPENFMNVKKSSSNAKYAAKSVPPFCEIWFINKGEHIWTREASGYQNFWPPMLTADENAQEKRLRFRNWAQVEPDQVEIAGTATASSSMDRVSLSTSSLSGSSTTSGCTYDELRGPQEHGFKVEEESFYNRILKAMTESETSKNEAFAEFLTCRKFELESAEAIKKVKAIEAAYASEVHLRKEVENTLRTTRQEQETFLELREEASRKLQMTLRDVAVLGSRVTEANHRQYEASRELRLLQMSLTTLRHERNEIYQQKEKALRLIEWWRSHGQAQSSTNCVEYSLSDLLTATCNFSESFKIGHGRYGCVYKGEISDRSVAIKKLHPLGMQGKLDFQQEVQVLSKLRHPKLVTLIGACPETWSLVSEYLPNGSLQENLFNKTNSNSLTWKIRTRIAADIANALLYLHAFRPERFVHGDLKPGNILLDSEFNCKLADFGISRFVTEDVRCPSFRGMAETMNVFPYMDPEFPETRVLTPKSDTYSMGIIILQLITGRPPIGLVSEVRRAVYSGNMAPILDPSAGEWPAFVAKRLVELGLKCCELRSQDRLELGPTIVKELEQLHLAEQQPVPSFFFCPISPEIMHDPHVAADGFTYEREAMGGWLKNGRETSPMTNLKLSHLHLTPNHALWLAIQDWPCLSCR